MLTVTFLFTFSPLLFFFFRFSKPCIFFFWALTSLYFCMNGLGKAFSNVRACLHVAGGPQIVEVTCGRLPHLTCKHDHIKMRHCTDRRVTTPKRVTSPTWGHPPPCKQALRLDGRKYGSQVEQDFH